MIKTRIKQIRENILNSLNISSEFVYLRDILDSSLDEPYKKFLSAEVRWWIYEDRLLRSANKSFDFKGMNKTEVNEQIDNIYWNNARFELNEFEELIKKAVRYRLNYLCRPKYTLMKFIFADQPTRLAKEVLMKLDYFTDYSYLLDSILSSINIDSEFPDENEILNRNGFENLLDEIDAKMIDSLDVDGLRNLLDNLIFFFGIKKSKVSKVPSELIVLFLKEKNLNPISDKLVDFCRKRKIELLPDDNITEFFNLLGNVSVTEFKS
jgi:hypothetical protein